MPLTTQCPNCGVVLTLPDGAEGRRLRCPKCDHRFQAGGGAAGGGEPKRPSSSSGTHRPTSSLLLSTRHDEPGMPQADRDLREAFAPDLLLGEDRPASKAEPAKPKTNPAGPIADAGSLFADDPPTQRPRGPRAEDRSKPRRCPSCGSVVPAGMSLCNRCGLDLDTGRRTQIDEMLEDVLPPPAKPGPPLSVSILGGVVLVASLAMAVVALVQTLRPEVTRWGYLALAVVGAYGAYAAVQFLRMKSARLLLVALLLGGLIDVIALIGLPIYEANVPPAAAEVFAPVGPGDEDLPKFQNPADRLDRRRVNWGIAVLLLDAGAIFALMTPEIRRHF